MRELELLKLKLDALVVFRKLLSDDTMRSLSALLGSTGKTVGEQVGTYADFAHRLYARGGNITEFVRDLALSDENIYLMKRAAREPVPDALEECVGNELGTLRELSRLESREILCALDCGVYLPEWATSEIDIAREYAERMGRLHLTGYGVYAGGTMFTFGGGMIRPVGTPDRVRLSNLIGYERERGEVIANTLAFLDGRPAANTLLYGDAGTGKSSTVKAVANEFANRGLRLVEIRKECLSELHELIGLLAVNPLKFIIFVDDLSFEESGAEIGVLKAILEGSVSARAKNTVIYATSNRRHLVRETFSERGDDDINRNETIQEQISLSERFGLAVSFFKPDRDEYLRIVRGLAAEYGFGEVDGLELLAERHAMRHGGRSGRAARQFVEALSAGKQENTGDTCPF